jgi:hypothetical protein
VALSREEVRLVSASRDGVPRLVCSLLYRAGLRLFDLARPTYELLLEALRQSHVVHADETGWRIGRLNA